MKHVFSKKILLVTCELFSERLGEKERSARWGQGVLSGNEIVGSAADPVSFMMSGNPLCCLFRKCKNSNKSGSDDSVLEGRRERTRAFSLLGARSPASSWLLTSYLGWAFRFHTDHCQVQSAVPLITVVMFSMCPACLLLSSRLSVGPWSAWNTPLLILACFCWAAQCGCWNLLCRIKMQKIVGCYALRHNCYVFCCDIY